MPAVFQLLTGTVVAPAGASADARSGFTLIELVVALAIGSILTFLAVHNMTDSIPRQQLKEAGQNLVGQLRLARQKAIAEGKEATLSFFPESNRYEHPVFGKQTLPPRVRFGVPSGLSKAPNKGSTIPKNGVRFGDDKKTITFKSDGTVFEGGSIYLTNSRLETVAISINITGRVKQYRWNGNGWQ